MLDISKSFPKALRESVEKLINHNLRANKGLGQHFLCDAQICDQIALSGGDLSHSSVLEVGPGLGSLSQAILALNPGVELTVIEADNRFIDILNEIGNFYNNSKFKVEHCDALQYNFSLWAAQTQYGKRHIIANLPYNIGTELLFKWLNQEFFSNIQSIIVMLQKEVIRRIVALHNSKSYSWLSVFSQLLCDTEILFDVPQSAFSPAPKVMSSVVLLRPKKVVLPHNMEKLRLLCTLLFLHRRKTVGTIIKNSPKFQHLLSVFEGAQIDLTKRPEQLDIPTLCNLSLLI
jgi:16S rRNA (adenine1518-N6/adenine1519-N6)-dimethyltransferase